MNEEIQRKYVEELIDQFCAKLNNIYRDSQTEDDRTQIILMMLKFNQDLSDSPRMSAWEKAASEEDNYL